MCLISLKQIFQPDTSSAQIPEERFILIDTDAGTDDAWAIFLALAAHKAYDITGLKIVGLTTGCGNSSVDNVSINVTRTLETADENSVCDLARNFLFSSQST